MPSSKFTCQAKEPALCRYHGSGSESYATTLKARLEVAGQAYKAVQHTSRAYASFSILKEAQNSYYATDTGILEIKSILKNNELALPYRTEVEKVYNAALSYRKLYEKNLSIDTIFPPRPPRPYVRLPMGVGLLENDTSNISTFIDEKNGITFNINWVHDQGHVMLSSSTNRDEDILIGQAQSVDEATRKATEWYNRNYFK